MKDGCCVMRGEGREGKDAGPLGTVAFVARCGDLPSLYCLARVLIGGDLGIIIAAIVK